MYLLTNVQCQCSVGMIDVGNAISKSNMQNALYRHCFKLTCQKARVDGLIDGPASFGRSNNDVTLTGQA